jgi:hypothetical protein
MENASINTGSAGDLSSAETCRQAAPVEMNRGVFKGIDGCRDTWADWAVCGIGWSEEEGRVGAFLNRHKWQTLPTSQEIAEARQSGHVLGRAAFARGDKRVPAFDADYRALQAAEPYPIGDARGKARLHGWLAGWNEANAAARLE